jgi:hypothetical protein
VPEDQKFPLLQRFETHGRLAIRKFGDVGLTCSVKHLRFTGERKYGHDTRIEDGFPVGKT